MRIGIDMLGVQSAESRGRGIGRYSRSLVSTLLTTGPEHEYILYAHADLSTDDFPEAPHAEQRLLTREATAAAAIDRIARTNPDRLDTLLILSPFELHQGYGPPAKPLGGLAMAAVIYDLIPFLFQERYLNWPPMAMKFYTHLERLRRYDVLLAISSATRDDCRRLLGLGADRVVNIRAASNPEFFTPADRSESSAEARSTLAGLSIARPYVFCLGSTDERKNLLGLIDAFQMLPDDLRNSHQLVVACALEGADASRIRARAEERNVADQLVLTGEIPDTTLRTLYRQCAAFAFPSLYEGFGLPILEAMLCGAPVVAGNNSSQIEVVGDAGLLANATDPSDVAAKLRSVLEDDDVAGRLRSKGLAHAASFTWDDVAQRTLAGITDVGARRLKRRGRLRADLGHAPRPRIALFSPFPPKRSGISDYAARLVASLGRSYAIDIYHDAGYIPDLGLGSAELACYDHRLFPRNAHQFGYRGILYQMGNSLYHGFIYEAMRRQPGIVTLHDFCLAGFHYWYGTQGQSDPEHFPRELAYSHPECAEAVVPQLAALADEPGGIQGACSRRGVTMNRRVFEVSKAVVVHSPWCVEQVRRERPGALAKTHHIPYGAEALDPAPEKRAAIRARFGLPAEAFLVGSLGILHPSKMNVETVQAFAPVAASRPDALLIFVGPDFGKGETLRAAEELGLRDRVRFFGQQPADVLAEFAAVTDLGINLRLPPTNGETSAALLDLLRLGVPTVVTDVATFADYPDTVVRKVNWETEGLAGLTHAVAHLVERTDTRLALGRAALTYVRETHSWSLAAARYRDLIERCFTETRPRSARETAGDAILSVEEALRA